jgi:nicotinate-nucleotide adenylyltransferase
MKEKEGVKKLGVLGGSFDPVHIGHLIIAEAVADAYKIDRVLFVPCFIPPHKRHKTVADGGHRLKMIERAIEDNDRFAASDRELRRGGVSYSIDTMREIRAEWGDTAELYFIMGGDSLVEFSSWKCYRELLELCTIVVAARPGSGADTWRPPAGAYTEAQVRAIRAHILKTPLIGISATGIREQRRAGGSVRYLVPERVRQYIEEHNLYGR